MFLTLNGLLPLTTKNKVNKVIELIKTTDENNFIIYSININGKHQKAFGEIDYDKAKEFFDKCVKSEKTGLPKREIIKSITIEK